MSALRAQNKLAMAAWQGMKDAAAGNERGGRGARTGGGDRASASLPPDVAAAATALDAKLATFGGATGRGGRAAAVAAAAAAAAAARARRAA